MPGHEYACRDAERADDAPVMATLEPLRAAIAAAGAKVEQETIQQQLYALLEAGGEPGSRRA